MLAPSILTFVLALLLAACAGDGPSAAANPTPNPTPGTGPALQEIQERVFNINCLFAGCHNAGDRQADLVLEPGLSWAQLVGRVPANADAAAAGLLRVSPFTPDQSFLVAKLSGPPAAQGSRMPLGLPALSADDIDLIRTWILAGAPDLPSRATAAAQLARPSPTASATPSEDPSPTATATATTPRA